MVIHRLLMGARDAEIRDSHERLVAQKDLHLDDLKQHLEDMKLTVKQLDKCILIVSAIAAVIVISLIAVTCYLLGLRDEQKRRLEAQNYRFEGIVQEKNERIHHLEARQENSSKTSDHSDSQQQPILYAFPTSVVQPRAGMRVS